MGRIIIPGQPEPVDETEDEPFISGLKLHELVGTVVEVIRARPSAEPITRQLQQLIAAAYDANQVMLGAVLLEVLHAMELSCLDAAFEDLFWVLEQFKVARATQACQICGCTNERACDGGCYWVELDLCSRCAEAEDAIIQAEMEDS
jgi:hypothetical protein